MSLRQLILIGLMLTVTTMVWLVVTAETIDVEDVKDISMFFAGAGVVIAFYKIGGSDDEE